MTVLPERIVLFEIVGGEGGEALYLNPSQDKELDDGVSIVCPLLCSQGPLLAFLENWPFVLPQIARMAPAHLGSYRGLC